MFKKTIKLIKKRFITLVFSISVILFIIVSMELISFESFGLSDALGLIAGLSGVLGFVRLIGDSQKAKQLKEAEFLSELNRDFITNPIICNLYEKLEQDYRSKSKTSCIKDEDILSFVVYFTFFETIYDCIRKNIIKIENIDDLFGYRFFIMTNNKKIQDIELTTKVLKSSYVNIFKLYEIWSNYRLKVLKKTSESAKHNIAYFTENLYLNHYDDIKEYLDSPKSFIGIELARKRDFFTICRIQRIGYKIMKKAGKKELFQPSSTFDLYQLIASKHMYVKKGFWGIEGYIGYMHINANKGLGKHLKVEGKGILLDTVFVDTRYRGLGIQKTLMDHVLSHHQSSFDYAVATVDPQNTYSSKNFTDRGFKVYKADVLLYGGKHRDIYYKSLD